MSECRRLPPNRRKTRSGCLRCKQRRIKCDETSPACNQCTRRGYDCPGFTRTLKWSSKHEHPKRPNTDRAHGCLSAPVSHTSDPEKALQPFEILSEDHPLTGTSYLESDQMNRHFGSPRNEMMPANDDSVFLTPPFLSGSSLWDQVLADNLQNPEGEEQDNHDLQVLWDNIPISNTLNGPENNLSTHYFSSICRINSAVDSPSNPFRAWVANSIQRSSLVYHCVLSMSAAHLAERNIELRNIASEHRTKAISQLECEILEEKRVDGTNNQTSPSFKPVVLLSCILLGTTDSWHNPTMLGLRYLHSARVLFQRCDAKSTGPADSPKDRNVVTFLAGLLSYWEALVSFIRDQSLDATSYLSSFIKEDNNITSNPWTGVSTPLFIYLARVGALGRQRATLKRIGSSTLASDSQERISGNLIEQARELEKAILGYRVPTPEMITQTHDMQTPASHLIKIARIYRLTALLEIYRTFPELLSPKDDGTEAIHSLSPAPYYYQGDFVISKLLALAKGILTLVSTLPIGSGANIVLSVPLIVAGSVLQSPSPDCSTTSAFQNDELLAELVAIHNEDGILGHWRSLVRTRFQEMYSYIGLPGVLRALDVVERTWFRADLQRLDNSKSCGERFVHWTDVMIEERLETIFG